MADPRRMLGGAGEHVAERALRARGWKVLARNARTRYGEIDLICHDGSAYVFVEVKTRRDGSFVSAAEAAGPRKLARLERLSNAWLGLHGERGASWRLMIVALTVGPRGTHVETIDVTD